MNNAIKTMACNAKSALKSLFGASIEKNYDLTLSLYSDAESQKPICSHHFKGNSRHSLIKAVALVGSVSIMISAVCSLCSCMRSH